MYYQDDKLSLVVDSQWVRIAKMGANLKLKFERFSMGDLREVWETLAPSNIAFRKNFVAHLIDTVRNFVPKSQHMAVAREAVTNYHRAHKIRRHRCRARLHM